MYVFGIVGLVLISIAVWIKSEKRQDVIFIAGGLCLLVYSLYIRDLIFIVLQVLFVISTLVEIIKIKHHESN